jgi:soluble lytic murein transglycosylase-like protein
MRTVAFAWALAITPCAALAGAQIEEQLADSVRSGLSAAVSDRAAPVLEFRDMEQGRRWLNEMSARLARRMPDRARRTELLKTVQYEALRSRLDPQLVLGLIEVESGFRKYAVSSAGARGYMQVMPFWVKQIGKRDHNLFNLRTNLRYGCVILRHYLDIENGDYYRALGRYNGSLGRSEYPNLVLGAWRGRWGYTGATS